MINEILQKAPTKVAALYYRQPSAWLAGRPAPPAAARLAAGLVAGRPATRPAGRPASRPAGRPPAARPATGLILSELSGEYAVSNECN